MSKFLFLNQKVKQIKFNVNIGNLRKLGNFIKFEMKVNFLKLNLKVNFWKLDSNFEIMENIGVMDNKVQVEFDGEMFLDNDLYYFDEFFLNFKFDEDRQLVSFLENVGLIDYVLFSCGIIVLVFRVGSRFQFVSSIDISIFVFLEVIVVYGSGFGKGYEFFLKKSFLVDNIYILIGFVKFVDIYCYRFV